MATTYSSSSFTWYPFSAIDTETINKGFWEAVNNEYNKKTKKKILLKDFFKGEE